MISFSIFLQNDCNMYSDATFSATTESGFIPRSEMFPREPAVWNETLRAFYVENNSKETRKLMRQRCDTENVKNIRGRTREHVSDYIFLTRSG